MYSKPAREKISNAVENRKTRRIAIVFPSGADDVAGINANGLFSSIVEFHSFEGSEPRHAQARYVEEDALEGPLVCSDDTRVPDRLVGHRIRPHNHLHTDKPTDSATSELFMAPQILRYFEIKFLQELIESCCSVNLLYWVNLTSSRTREKQT